MGIPALGKDRPESLRSLLASISDVSRIKIWDLGYGPMVDHSSDSRARVLV